MKNQWRPDGWNTLRIIKSVNTTKGTYFDELIEAGADAMLEALKRKGLYGGEKPYWDFGPNFWGIDAMGESVNIGNLGDVLDVQRGWLVFIPDEG